MFLLFKSFLYFERQFRRVKNFSVFRFKNGIVLKGYPFSGFRPTEQSTESRRLARMKWLCTAYTWITVWLGVCLAILYRYCFRMRIFDYIGIVYCGFCTSTMIRDTEWVALLQIEIWKSCVGDYSEWTICGNSCSLWFGKFLREAKVLFD